MPVASNVRNASVDCSSSISAPHEYLDHTGLSFFAGLWRRRTALAAENLFLRKQLALFREREKKAMPTTPADRFVFSKLARWFDWRSALLIVRPATLIGWHRNAFRLFWRWKSRPVGRPQIGRAHV